MRPHSILILDDDDLRGRALTRIYSRKYAESFIVLVKTHQEAAGYLARMPFDMVTLDHDLGTEHTGLDTARYIAQMLQPPPEVFVHSSNPVGADNMVQVLQTAGVNVKRVGL